MVGTHLSKQDKPNSPKKACLRRGGLKLALPSNVVMVTLSELKETRALKKKNLNLKARISNNAMLWLSSGRKNTVVVTNPQITPARQQTS